MKALYTVVYYRSPREIVSESIPRDRVSYPPEVMIGNSKPKEKYDYAVIEERYYPV